MIAHERVEHFLVWLASTRPMHWRRITIAIHQRRPDEPYDLQWVTDNAASLVNRLPSLTTWTRATYASHVRSAINRYSFSQGQPLGIRAAHRDVPAPLNLVRPAPPTPAEQLTEALQATARWPALHRYLLPGLVEASKEIDGAKATAVSAEGSGPCAS